MTVAKNKTTATDASVDEFIDSVADEQKRADSRRLCELMTKISGHEPVLWGPSIIGFGSYHYRYESGREGDAGAMGFSPRKRELTIYLGDGTSTHAEELANLGPHRTAKVCLYVKRLADLDLAVLERVLTASYHNVMALDSPTNPS